MKQIRHIAVVIVLMLSYKANSQIGINTLTPDNSAALDIYPPAAQSAGVLIPRLTQSQRVAIPSPANGLMVFDVTDNLFYVYLLAGTPKWYVINPWLSTARTGSASAVYTHSAVTGVGIGTSAPSAKLEVVGSTKTTTLQVPGFSDNALVPTGGIIMWSGTAPPPGWAMCDGAVHGTITTPDLRGRFIVGYNPLLTDYDQPGNLSTPANTTGGDTGGEEKHTLTKSELPTHNHKISNYDGSNTGTATYGDMGLAYTKVQGGTYNSGNTILTDQPYNVGGPIFSNTNSIKVPYDPTLGYTGDGSHANTGGLSQHGGLANQPHENRPPYYVLAYIIKLP